MPPEPERLPGSPPSLGCSLCDTCSWSRRAVRIKRIHIHTFPRAFTDTEINESQPLFLLLFGYFVLNAHKSNMDEDCKLILQDENPSLFSSENACGHLLSHVLLSKVQLSLQKSQLPPPSQGSHPPCTPRHLSQLSRAQASALGDDSFTSSSPLRWPTRATACPTPTFPASFCSLLCFFFLDILIEKFPIFLFLIETLKQYDN